MANQKTENPYKEGDLLGESVKQHQRMAMGAFVDGTQYAEKKAATMKLANSDHGNFAKESIAKSNS